MRIQMLKTLSLAGSHPLVTFHAGHYYHAEPAFNQPNHIRDGLVFVERQGKKLTNLPQSMLVSRANKEFRIV
jgi:hypothetical protein